MPPARSVETNPVVIPVASGTVIEIGDLVYLSSGNALPAAQIDSIADSLGRDRLRPPLRAASTPPRPPRF
jgi:hypothetical protein